MSPSPKIDRKGKGKATPQDEEPPELLYHHQQPPVVEEPAERSLEAPSPVERSRKWVEEEGEVFRKGTVLLGPEEMGEVEEGDGAQVAGDVLRIEVSIWSYFLWRSLLNLFSAPGGPGRTTPASIARGFRDRRRTGSTTGHCG